MRILHRPRAAATTIEFALVGSVTFLLLLGLLIGGMGIFRYQQVANLARDGSRWASVHGTQYAKDTKNTAATDQDVYNQAIKPYAAGLDTSKLTYSVTWNTSNDPYHTATVNSVQVQVANTVTVTVTYQWVPEAYLGGITLSSTSVSVMSY
ncbi:MAG TPA: TadE/TadG family type IV pilus assembly protein [Gemmataceae bacterium]|nr:TadE/TadG family type IV pilus assembly protein [Gemmataceae bacterium]